MSETLGTCDEVQKPHKNLGGFTCHNWKPLPSCNCGVPLNKDGSCPSCEADRIEYKSAGGK